VTWFSRRPLITEELWAAALRRHPITHRYSAEELPVLRGLAERFLRTMQIRWAPGMEPLESARVSLALLACIPVLNLDLRWYRRWRTTLLVPRDYRSESVEVDEAGVVHEGFDDAAGEYSGMGTVVLSLADIGESGQGTGFNVVIHECAHVLDNANGAIDGLPPLHAGMDVSLWSSRFTDAYEDLQSRLSRRGSRGRSGRRGRLGGRGERGGRGGLGRRGGPGGRDRRTVFDSCAAESPEEFFAVASELFFERPRSLFREYPQVYRQLVLFYRQDRAQDRAQAAAITG
jgi:MtfA peptidase